VGSSVTKPSPAPDPVGSSPDAARLWRRIVPTLAAIVAVIAFVSAGNWQRGRLAEKDALAAQLAAAAAAPPVPIGRIDGDPALLRYRVVEARGRFDGARQLLLDNRLDKGRIGYHVVTPLLLPDGRAVLVNRGFVPANRVRSDLPDTPAPAGEVAIRARINLPPRYLELGAPPAGKVWQNLDLARFAQSTGLAVVPFVLEELQGTDDGLVRDWAPPVVDGSRHRVYMLQWYAFAALAAGFWAYFHLWRRRR
jgi:surfeit locus 1 family protein